MKFTFQQDVFNKNKKVLIVEMDTSMPKGQKDHDDLRYLMCNTTTAALRIRHEPRRELGAAWPARQPEEDDTYSGLACDFADRHMTEFPLEGSTPDIRDLTYLTTSAEAELRQAQNRMTRPQVLAAETFAAETFGTFTSQWK